MEDRVTGPRSRMIKSTDGTACRSDVLLRPAASCDIEMKMNEDFFNTSIRKSLKRLGVTAQREIEKAVRQGLADGKLKGNEGCRRRRR